jgi:hypothetical protein
VPPAHRTFGRAMATTTRSKRFLGTRTRAEHGRVTFAALTVLYAVLPALLGVLVDVLENPPFAVTAIIVATAFGVLIANEARLRGRA